MRLIFQFRGIQFSFLLKLLTLKSHPRNGQFKSTTKRCLILDALIDRVQMGADLHGHQWAQVITYWLSSEAPGATQCPKCPKVHGVCWKDIALWKNLESYGFREIFEQRQNAFFLPRPEVGRVGQAAALGDSCFWRSWWGWGGFSGRCKLVFLVSFPFVRLPNSLWSGQVKPKRMVKEEDLEHLQILLSPPCSLH